MAQNPKKIESKILSVKGTKARLLFVAGKVKAMIQENSICQKTKECCKGIVARLPFINDRNNETKNANEAKTL